MQHLKMINSYLPSPVHMNGVDQSAELVLSQMRMARLLLAESGLKPDTAAIVGITQALAMNMQSPAFFNGVGSANDGNSVVTRPVVPKQNQQG